MTNFVFCFPYRGVGGVPVLFTRIGECIVRSGGHEVSVVDYPDGAMAKIVAGSSMRLIAYDDNLPVAIPEGAILVFQSLNPWALYASLRIPDTTRIFFWNCHPFNLVPVFPGLRGLMMSRPALGRVLLSTVLRRYRSIVVRLIQFMLVRGALAFMDKGNVENTQNYLGLTLPPQEYLPIPAGEICSRLERPPRNWKADGLRLAWIGRIADFKYPILSKTLILLDRLAPALGVPIRFKVVGAGEYLDNLMHDVNSLRNTEVELIGELPVSGIAPFLMEDVDILFAMGISALEGVRLGIPTVLLDVAYGPVPDGYLFSWLHERNGFTLGEVLSSSHIRPGNRSLETILRNAMADFDGVSRAAHAYYAGAHSAERVTEKFLQRAELSRCFYNDFRREGFSARDPLYEIFARLRKRFIPQ